jgi:hypothetical protein
MSNLVLIIMELRLTDSERLFMRSLDKSKDSVTIFDLERLARLLEGSMSPAELKSLLIKEAERLGIQKTDIAWRDSIDTIMGVLLLIRPILRRGIDIPLHLANRQTGAGPSIERLENTKRIRLRYPVDNTKSNANSFSSLLLVLMRIVYLLRAPLLVMVLVVLQSYLKNILTSALNRAGTIKDSTIAALVLSILLLYLILLFQRMS